MATRSEPVPVTSAPVAELTEIVRVDSGPLRGTIEHGCRVFRGIPYAASTAAQSRWRIPQPVQPWSAVRLADRFADACPQPQHASDALMAQFAFAHPPECAMSEDCLSLNIWAPADLGAQPLPVIVWIYGGGNRFGAGSHPVSSGFALAQAGAVVVTLNYRVGGLGFLAHPALTAETGSSGNYCCHDVLAALHWIQRNIGAFGGDPTCVTVFGQSAGAAIASVLMVMPQARGLFHRVIAHSSGRFRGGQMGTLPSRAEAEAAGTAFMRTLGAETAAQMRALSAAITFGAPRQWNLIVDGELLTDTVQALFERREQLQIPVLCGFNRDEATPYPLTDLQGVRKFLGYAGGLGADAEEFLEIYPHASDADTVVSSYQVRRDTAFAYQAWMWARTQLRCSAAPVFLFEFERAVPLPASVHFHEPRPPAGFGAYHGAELWYVFNTLSRQPWDWSEDDQQLAALMGRYWVNFARSGDPNGVSLPTWPRFDADLNALHLDSAVRAGAPSNVRALQLFERHFARRGAGF